MNTATLKTKASDVSESIGDGVQAAKRALRHTANDMADYRDAAGLRIRRAPLSSVAIALVTGVAIGCLIGSMRRPRR